MNYGIHATCLAGGAFQIRFSDKIVGFTTEEKIRILPDAGRRGSVTETCKEFTLSDVTFHRWKRQFRSMGLNEARRLKKLEKETSRTLIESAPV